MKTIKEKYPDGNYTINNKSIPKKTNTYGYHAHVLISGNVFKNT